MTSHTRPASSDAPPDPCPTLLITAGPTHEPIDAVRFIGNRSSGRLGIALAEHAAASGWNVRLLLGPTERSCSDSRIHLLRFRTVADLQALLLQHAPHADVLVMAAAVADYRPRAHAAHDKLRRADGPRALELEPTPDLLAGLAATRPPGQRIVGFALEPADRLLESARDKLRRKNVDLIVANPLETMDAPDIDATVVDRDGRTDRPGRLSKPDFARWLLARIDALVTPRHAPHARA